MKRRHILIAALAMVTLAIGGALLTLRTAPGRTFVAARVLAMAGGAIGQQVRAGKIGGDWPNHIVLDGVTVGDAAGTWLTVDHLALDWHAAALLRNRVEVDALRADTVHMSRRPISANGGGGPDFIAIRPALARVTLQSLAIQALQIDEPVLGRSGTVAVTGAIRAENDGPVATLSLERKDAPGAASFTLRLPAGAFTLQARAAIAGVSLDGDIAMDQRTNRLSGRIDLACGGDDRNRGAPCLQWTGGKLDAAAVKAQMSGTLSAPEATATLNVTDLADDGRALAAFTGTAVIAPAENGLALRGEGTARGLKAAVPELAAVIADEGAWSLKGETAGRRLTVTALKLDAGDAAVTAAGIADAGALSEVAGSVTLRRAGRLLGLADDTSTTQLDLAFDSLSFAPFAAAGRLTAAVEDAPPGMSLAPLAAGTLRLSSTATFANGRLTFSGVTGRFGTTSFTGTSAWVRGAHGLDHAATTFTASAAIPANPATIRVEGRLQGALAALTAELTATASDVALAGGPVNDLRATVSAASTQTLWHGKLQADGNWRGFPLTLSTDFAQDSPSMLALSATRATVLGSTVDGALRIDTRTSLVAGALAGKIRDLAPLTAFIGIPAQGTGDLAVAFAANAGQRLTLNLKGAGVAGGGLTAESLTTHAVIDDAWGVPKLALRVKAADAAVLGRPVAQISLTGDGGFDKIAVQIQATGTGLHKFSLDTGGTVSIGSEIGVDIARLALRDGNVAATLTAPTRFTYAPASVALAPTRVAVNGGTATAQFTLDRRADRVTGAATLSQVVMGDLTAISGDLPGAARNVIDASLTISGAATEADADLAVTSHYNTRDSGIDVLAKLEATLRQGRAKIRGTAAGLSAEDATLAADIPAHLDLTGPRLALDMNAPMTGALAWRGDVKPLWGLFALDEHLLSGQGDVDLAASGTLEQPVLTGGIKLSKARYENLSSGTAMQNLDADITAGSGASMTVKLSATDTGSGRVSAQGALTLDRATGHWTVDAAGDLAAFHILRRDDVTATATGHVTYKGPPLAGTLAGRLQVMRSEMRIGASYVPEIPLLRAKIQGPPPEPGRPSTVQLDITLAIDDVLRIDGKGLEAFWRGELKARGSLDAPDVSGTLTLARGTFTFLGTSFDLDTGSVTFTGGGKIDPELALTASTQSADVTATVTISGRASQPNITLSSVPALPQDEVLARLLFRKGATQLGPLESLQLASAAADLAGLSQGGLSGMLRRTFGLDIVGFGGKSGDAVVLGHQITSALYVGVEQSVGATNQHQIVVEWRISRSLSVQSTTTAQTGADLGLIWRKNY